MQDFSRISGLLIDLEGVLYSDNKLIEGAIETIKTIRKNNFKIRFLTNTTIAPVKQILEKYVNWDRIAEMLGMVPVPHGLLKIIGKDMTENQIDTIVDALYTVIIDSTMFVKGGNDLERTIEMLEDYMKASGMKSDHRVEGEVHHFIIQHGIGMTWSLFIEKLLMRIFKERTPDKEAKCQLTATTVIVSIPLGSDFDEHSY